ncbi:helix-turn-helix transcriptional regulator [Bacillaceae bacterium IKA-2]|nr:helix-turn-helix transcriptional regulator [Bacillaceae bacterium IKA-2]
MFGLNKPRSKFGKWIDKRGIKQGWIAKKASVSKAMISQLAISDDRVPTLNNAKKIIKALKSAEYSVDYSDFWDM